VTIRHDQYGTLGMLGPRPAGDARPSPASRASARPRPRRVEGLDLRRAGDGYVVTHRPSGRTRHLDPVAAFVLGLCDGWNTPDSIAEAVQKTYGLATRPRREVRRTLARLASAGLISS
jgi:hypothetical protein